MRGRGLGLAVMACAALGAGCTSHAASPRSSPARSTTTTAPYPDIYVAPTTTTLLKVPTRPGLRVDTPVRVDHAMTLSGSGCAPGNVADAGIGFAHQGPEVTVTPRADGTWTATVMVPDDTVPGPNYAEAYCERASNKADYFTYTPVPVDITTPRRLLLTPATHLTPGTTIRVTPNLGCSTLVGAAVVAITNPTGLDPGDPLGPGAVANARLDRTGRWTARVTIPRNVPPGTYVISASCVYFRATSGTYPAVAIKVLPSR